MAKIDYEDRIRRLEQRLKKEEAAVQKTKNDISEIKRKAQEVEMRAWASLSKEYKVSIQEAKIIFEKIQETRSRSAPEFTEKQYDNADPM